MTMSESIYDALKILLQSSNKHQIIISELVKRPSTSGIILSDGIDCDPIIFSE